LFARLTAFVSIFSDPECLSRIHKASPGDPRPRFNLSVEGLVSKYKGSISSSSGIFTSNYAGATSFPPPVQSSSFSSSSSSAGLSTNTTPGSTTPKIGVSSASSGCYFFFFLYLFVLFYLYFSFSKLF
jgi:hypothetical protein